ncbi:MAG: GHKL domain-containing protein [Gammaproteobacteria bacterium]|nr:GHKL domain-containing protein [Gammaproteobacteria bacterium]
MLLVFLGLMYVGLNNAFRQSVVSNAEDALKNQALLLMANIDVQDRQIVVPEVLSEARLSQTDSDLFAQIRTPESGVVWRSESLLGAELPLMPSALGEFHFLENHPWPGQPQIYVISFAAAWETAEGDLPFSIQVAERKTAYLKRLRQYQRQVAIWLSVLGVALLTLLLLLLSWALKPLGRVSRQIGEIEQGKRRRFDENYPNEVSGLTQNLNQLLQFEEQRIARQKDVLGNLAHSLKTPIAVLRGLQFSAENKAEAEHQLGAMQNIIDYQLQSASAVGRRRFAKPFPVSQPTRKIVNSLNKLYQGKGLRASLNIADDVVFFGDQGDWMELVGNLLDNAYKWANEQVLITVTNHALGSHRSAICIEVIDDGVGIDKELKSTILKRGVRLDSQTPGHGLGLHIVKGIIESYDGELSIQDNLPHGTIFKAVLN